MVTKGEEALALLAVHEERLERLAGDVKSMKDTLAKHAEFGREITDVKATLVRLEDFGPAKELHAEFVLLRNHVDEIRSSRKQVADRLWNIAGPVVGAIVGLVLGYFLRGS